MTIRKFFAATAIAGGFVLATSSLAFASDARTETTLAPGAHVCVSLPSTSDPVRAEGIGDPGVTFTLTADGQLLDQSADGSTFNSSGGPGAVELCASNGNANDAYVRLILTSGSDADSRVSDDGTLASAQPGPVVVSTPADDSTSADDNAQSLVDQIQQLIDEIVDEVLAALSAVA